MVEKYLERFLFASRWILAPFYVALVFGLLALLVKMFQHTYELVAHLLSANESQVILTVLGLVDLTFTAALITIVIFSGYENFVSRIHAEDHPDWPEWMARIDFTGLKLKLLSSIVAISAIQLLRAFMEVGNMSNRDLAWLVGIHLTFVVSSFLLALTDRFSASHGKTEIES